MKAIEYFAIKSIEFDPKSAASSIEKCDITVVTPFLESLADKSLIDLLKYFHSYFAAAFIRSIDTERAAHLLQSIPIGTSAAILRTLDKHQREGLITFFSKNQREIVRKHMSFLPKTAGTLMETSILPFRAKLSPKDCSTLISRGNRTHYYIYIVDDDDRLIGVTNLRRILELLPLKTSLGQICDLKPICIDVDSSISELIDHPAWTQFNTLPVVDRQSRFLGALHYSALRGQMLDKQSDSKRGSQMASAALGELYSIGITSLFGYSSSSQNAWSESK